MRADVVCEPLHLRASKAAAADADVANAPPFAAESSLAPSFARACALPPHHINQYVAKPTRFTRVGAEFRAEDTAEDTA